MDLLIYSTFFWQLTIDYFFLHNSQISDQVYRAHYTIFLSLFFHPDVLNSSSYNAVKEFWFPCQIIFTNMKISVIWTTA